MADMRKVAAYLYFGYVPAPPEKVEFPFPLQEFRDSVVGRSIPELIAEGADRFMAAVSAELSRCPHNSLHVVPLSGGLDSRAILAALLELGLRRQIVAVTVGVPGTLDYEIGALVASAAGVTHEAIDLRKVEVSAEGLMRTIRDGSAWTGLLEAYYHHVIVDRFGRDAIYWSGFLGDPSAGSHMPDRESHTWLEAVSRFISRNRMPFGLSLHPPDFDMTSLLPSSPLLDKGVLNYDEQLDLVIRQSSYVRPIVAPESDLYRVPFAQPSWIQFAYFIRPELRRNQILYKQTLRSRFPFLFSLPVKQYYGLPLHAPEWKIQFKRILTRTKISLSRYLQGNVVHPMTNYIDLDTTLRTDKAMMHLIRGALSDLQRRRLVTWVPIEELWEKHQRGALSVGRALVYLAALEYNLRAEVVE